LTVKLGNVPAHTRLEWVNLSSNPAATFNKDTAVSARVDGHDPATQQGVFALDAAQLQELDVKAGDVLAVRLVNARGRVSKTLNISVDATPPAEDLFAAMRRTMDAARILSDATTSGLTTVAPEKEARAPHLLASRIRLATWSPEQRAAALLVHAQWFTLQDALGGPRGEGPLTRAQLMNAAASPALAEELRKAIGLLARSRSVFSRAETVQAGDGFQQKDGKLYLSDLMAISKAAVTLHAPLAVEPGSSVMVVNKRTQQSNLAVSGTLQSTPVLNMGWPEGALRNGDQLEFRIVDHNGVEGEPLTVTYSARAKNGIAPQVRGPLGVRLGNVADET
jgi:hypothetical protein